MTGRAPHVEVRASAEEMAVAAARWLLARAERALQERNHLALVLAGGSTPRRLYELLASPGWRERVDWQRTHLFWGDERCVPPDSPDSNYRMVRESLLQHVPVPEAQVHRVRGELPPSEAAADYQEELEAFFRAHGDGFDVVLLGMGADGHTASLFPGDHALAETRRLAVPVSAPQRPPAGRVTLTYPAINAARAVAVLVAGQDKAARVAGVLSGADDAPVARVRPASGDLTWFLDEPAARGALIATSRTDRQCGGLTGPPGAPRVSGSGSRCSGGLR